ncbi:MAG: SpoIID/LytB domain-containing protein [Lachnospiraceae bacterium]|nr:SpoIID/LytB domain-containing protein [Lachnospiraceae bacterium]
MKLKKQHFILMGICLLLIGAMIIYRVFFYIEEEDGIKVSVAQVAKSIALMENTYSDCENYNDFYTINDEEKWYEKYMNAMYTMGYYTKDMVPATEKEALSAFTYGDLIKLLRNMGISDEKLDQIAKSGRKKSRVTTTKWNDIYERILEVKNPGDIQLQNMKIVATVSNVGELSTWETITDKGTFSFEGLALDYYLDNEISVYMRDKEIVWIKELISNSVTYENVWVTNCYTDKVELFMYDIIKTVELGETGSEFINSVADVTVTDKKVTSLERKKNTITGKVLASDYDYIEVEGYGKIKLEDNYKVYKVYGKLEEKGVRDILVGYDAQIFVIENEKICAAVMDRDINAENIRVLVLGEDKSKFHNRVILSSQGGMTITYGDNQIVTDPGEPVILDLNNAILDEGRAKFVSNDIKGKIKVESIERSYGTPAYRGSIEVAVSEDGLLVVNELPVEEYLYGVVPSEMPSYYPPEALKAQAVCARTYAYKHLLSNTFNKYGAHVDDSNSFQVYNNLEEQKKTNDAVNETYGEILTYEGEPIMAYFYSTSCGSTADSSIWGTDLPYIKNVLLSKDGKKLNLSDEAVFAEFIKNKYESFETEYSMFRWNVEFDLMTLTELVNSKIGSIYDNNKKHVLTLVNGEYIKQDIENVGVVKKITVSDRADSGVVNSIVIEGTEATVKVLYQSNVRKIFSPKGLNLYKNDGKSSSSMTSLPSGFFTLEEIKEDGVLTGYKVYGGGYGHGAGLSQNGAKGMAEELYDYKEILNKFYFGVELELMYE